MDKNGKSISGEGIIPGEKYDPYVIDGHRTISLDNVSAEVTINPVTDKQSFVEEINFMKHVISDLVEEKGLFLDIYPARMFDAEQVNTPHAQLLGCSEDYNIRLFCVNPRPDVTNFNGRSSGGHIHTAWENFDIEDAKKLIYQYDKNLALPMLFIEPETFRRRLYGKSSCVRLKEYGEVSGIEYRTLSNWFTSSNELMEFVWEGIIKSINSVNNDEPIEDWEVICEAIDTSNMELARQLMSKYNVQSL